MLAAVLATVALQPLVDLPPLDSATGHAPAIRATAPRALLSQRRVFRTRDGHSVVAYVSSAYGRGVSAARTYVDFLGKLPHGRELGRLRLSIRTPAEVQDTCGGEPGTLACYLIGSDLMVLPGQQVDPRYGVTVSSLMTHEYGHHIAMHRSNEPFDAIDWGPKRWASHERVCDNARRGRLFPADQGRNYLRNPGEAWADAYVRLKYPRARPWRYSELLRPTRRALRAARSDVEDPWTGREPATFASAFEAETGDIWRARTPLTLDGTVTVSLSGPPDAEYDLGVGLRSRRLATSSRPGSRDVVRIRAACRREPSEDLAVTVIRRSGEGPFTVTIRYPG